MSLKEFLMDKLMLFFTLSTLITIGIWILGSILDAETLFGYEAFLSPLMFAGACVLPTLVTYSKQELSVKQLIIRKILQFFLIEAVVLCIAFCSEAIHTEEVRTVVMLAVSVCVIYAVVHVIEWVQDSLQAQKMTAELLKLQEPEKEDRE